MSSVQKQSVPFRADPARAWAWAMAGLLALAMWARPAVADLMVSIDNPPPLAAGLSGAFEVWAANTGGPSSPNIDLALFTVQLNASGPIEFTGASALGTSQPYIFADSSLFSDPTQTLYYPTALPTQTLLIGDIEPNADEYATLQPGQTAALGLIDFSVDPGAAPGGYEVDISDHASGNSSLADEWGNDVDFAVSPGVVTVPEPATAALLAAASLLLLPRRRRA